MNIPARLAIVFFLTAASMLGVAEVRGANALWQVSSGTWSVAANWQSGTVPTSADDAFVINGGIAGIGAVQTCKNLTLGELLSGTVLLTAGGLTTGNTEYVGYSALGLFTQSAGTNTVLGSLILGTSASGDGTYNLNGGLLLSSAASARGQAMPHSTLTEARLPRTQAGPHRCP